MNEQHRQPVCKYYGTPRGCFSGNNCRFVHPEGAVSFPEGSTHGSGGMALFSLYNYVLKCHSFILLIGLDLAWCGGFIREAVLKNVYFICIGSDLLTLAPITEQNNMMKG